MVVISDHTYNFARGNGDPGRKLSVYFNVEMIVTGYYTYQSVWVVGEELPFQREWANSEDPYCSCGDNRQVESKESRYVRTCSWEKNYGFTPNINFNPLFTKLNRPWWQAAQLQTAESGWWRSLQVRSHAWMMLVHSKDSAHDLSVKLSPCLRSCPSWQTLLLTLHAWSVYHDKIWNPAVFCSLRLTPQWSNIFLVINVTPKLTTCRCLPHDSHINWNVKIQNTDSINIVQNHILSKNPARQNLRLILRLLLVERAWVWG